MGKNTGYIIFPSHYGLILTRGASLGVLLCACLFPSHYGLILTKPHPFQHPLVYVISIPLWSDFNGTQVFIYGIKKTKDGQKWIYKDSRKKPKDAKKNDVAYYLKKYLVKTFYALRDIQNKLNYLNELHKEFNLKNPAQREKFKEKKKELITEIYKKLVTIPFYLATNKRFFTSSKVPAYKPEVKEENTEYEYKIIGSFYYFDIPAFVLNHNQNQKKRSYTAIDYGSYTVYNSSSLGAW